MAEIIDLLVRLGDPDGLNNGISIVIDDVNGRVVISAPSIQLSGRPDIGISPTVSLQEFADNAAAIAGGVPERAFYHTGGVVKIVLAP